MVFSEQAVRAKRNRQVVPAPNLHSEERRVRDANDGQCMSIKTDRALQGSGIASEFALPKRMTEHCSGAARLSVILGAQCAAQHCINAKVAEEPGADVQPFGEARFSSVRKSEPCRAPRQHSGERLLVSGNLLPLQVRVENHSLQAEPVSKAMDTSSCGF